MLLSKEQGNSEARECSDRDGLFNLTFQEIEKIIRY